MYRAVPRVASDYQPRLRIAASDAEQMIKTHKLRPVPRSEIDNFCEFFTVAEWEKERRRAIEHPEAINDILTHVEKCTLPTRESIEQQSCHGPCAVCLDFMSWYDQFLLDEKVQKRFGLMDDQGNCYVLTRLPMGFRHAPFVAIAATEKLMALTHGPDVVSQSCIDNVRFVGERKAVVEAARKFVERCHAVGAQLNEIQPPDPQPDASDQQKEDPTPKEEEKEKRPKAQPTPKAKRVEDLVETEGRWLGLHINYEKKTVRVADKSVKKLQFTWAARNEWSNRGFAAHVGILMFISTTIGINLCDYYDAMTLVRRVGTLQDWNAPLAATQKQWASLERWTHEASLNKEKRMEKAFASDVHRHIFVDASALGWGAVSYDPRTGSVKTASGQWFGRFEKYKRQSVKAEPAAIYMAACRFGETHRPTTFWTDSITAKSVYNKRFSKNAFTNSVVKMFAEKFLKDDRVGPRWNFRFVPGSRNHADAFSRLRQPSIPVSSETVGQTVRDLTQPTQQGCWCSESSSLPSTSGAPRRD